MVRWACPDLGKNHGTDRLPLNAVADDPARGLAPLSVIEEPKSSGIIASMPDDMVGSTLQEQTRAGRQRVRRGFSHEKGLAYGNAARRRVHVASLGWGLSPPSF